jgi:hypothetical protein
MNPLKGSTVVKKVSLIAAAAVAVVAFMGVGSASAATLYTSAAHTVPVPVGTTFTASTPTTTDYSAYQVRQGKAVLEACNNGSFTFKVTQNSLGTFKAAYVNGSLSGCAPFAFTVVPTGELTVSGSSITVGTNRAWESTVLKSSVLANGSTVTSTYGGATGNPPAAGAFIREPATTGPAASIVLSEAGTFAGPIFQGQVTATYSLTGTAAGYSFN